MLRAAPSTSPCGDAGAVSAGLQGRFKRRDDALVE
jgi:hypothetical protein